MGYENENERQILARNIATEAMVLLKNENGVLPLENGKKVALLGRTQNATIIGGGGSGASRCDNPMQIRDELINAGINLEKGFDAFYQGRFLGRLKLRTHGENGVMVSLAALCTTQLLGIPTEKAIEFLERYSDKEQV